LFSIMSTSHMIYFAEELPQTLLKVQANLSNA